MVDRTVYTLSQDTLAKLREDHERLANMVLNLRQQLASRRPDGDYQWRVLSGVTATNDDWPTYPNETSDTYVVQIEKWAFVAEPGRQQVSQTEMPRTVVAHSHLERYLPLGSRVLVVEVIGSAGKRYYLLDGFAGGAAVCLQSAAWRTRSAGLDDVDVIGPGDPVAETPRFLAGDPAGVSDWDYEGDGWLVNLNHAPNSYLSPTVEITRTGVYELTLSVWMERGGTAWPNDLEDLAAALGVEYTDSDLDTLTARGYQDLRAVARVRLEAWDDPTDGWVGLLETSHELTTPSLRDTTGQAAESGETTNGSVECSRVIDPTEVAAYADVATTASGTVAARLSAGSRLRVSLAVVRTWTALAGAKLRYCTLLIRQIGNGSGGVPGTFADDCETPTTTTTAGPPTTTTVPPTTAPPTTAPPTTAPPTTAPPTTTTTLPCPGYGSCADLTPDTWLAKCIGGVWVSLCDTCSPGLVVDTSGCGGGTLPCVEGNCCAGNCSAGPTTTTTSPATTPPPPPPPP